MCKCQRRGWRLSPLQAVPTCLQISSSGYLGVLLGRENPWMEQVQCVLGVCSSRDVTGGCAQLSPCPLNSFISTLWSLVLPSSSAFVLFAVPAIILGLIQGLAPWTEQFCGEMSSVVQPATPRASTASGDPLAGAAPPVRGCSVSATCTVRATSFCNRPQVTS